MPYGHNAFAPIAARAVRARMGAAIRPSTPGSLMSRMGQGTLSAAGAASHALQVWKSSAPGGGGGGGLPATMNPAYSYTGGYRRMNVCNPKALRRAIRRTHGFAKLAMKTIHLVHPKKAVRFGGFRKKRAKR